MSSVRKLTTHFMEFDLNLAATYVNFFESNYITSQGAMKIISKSFNLLRKIIFKFYSLLQSQTVGDETGFDLETCIEVNEHIQYSEVCLF